MNEMALKPRVDDYTAEVRDIKNRVWTGRDRRTIYTMRQKGIVSSEIATILGVSKIQVHNETRLAIRAIKEQCYHCGRPLKEEEKKQIEYKDIDARAFAIYQERVAKGLAGTAENDWVQASEELKLTAVSLCTKCKKKESVYKRTRREDALEHNICGYCHSRPLLKGYCACVKCLSATHRRRNKAGLCGNCGKHPIGHNKVALCDVCAPVMAEKTARWRETH